MQHAHNSHDMCILSFLHIYTCKAFDKMSVYASGARSTKTLQAETQLIYVHHMVKNKRLEAILHCMVAVWMFFCFGQ